MSVHSDNKFKSYLTITIGSLLISSGLYFFLAPSQLAVGGISGLSIVLAELIPAVPMGVIMLSLNVVMFIIGFLIIGKSFGVKTIYSSLAISLSMVLYERIFSVGAAISQDTLIILIFGMLLTSIGQAMIFNQGASSGGTDIIAKIITKFFPVNIGKALQMADFFVICAAVSVFGIEKGLYALLGIMINGYLVDYIVAGFNISKFVTVISGQTKEVTDYIINDLNRSATVYQAKGAYSNEAREVITTVVNRRQFIQLKHHIAEIDPRAFVTVQQLHEVMGEGFTNL